MFTTSEPCVEEAKLSGNSIEVERTLSKANPKGKWVVVTHALLPVFHFVADDAGRE